MMICGVDRTIGRKFKSHCSMGMPEHTDWLISSSTDLAKGIQAFIGENPEVFGGADIYSRPFRNPMERAGLITVVLACLGEPTAAAE